MFEKIVLRRSTEKPTLTIGYLAEALFFYNRVHLFLDYATLHHFIREIGPKLLLSLLSRPNISAVYSEETLATKTERIAGIDFHDFIAFTIQDKAAPSPISKPERRIAEILTRLNHSKRESSKFSENFLEKVPVRNISSEYFIKNGVIKSASEDLLDNSYIQKAIDIIISKTAGLQEVKEDRYFAIQKYELGFIIETDIDFDSANKIRKIKYGLDPTSPAHLTANILNARADTIIAAKYGGDFQTSSLSSEIIKIRHGELLERLHIDRREINSFHDILLPNMPSIAEAVDSGNKSFSDFLKLLDKSKKFKDFLTKANPDEGLMREYIKAISSQDWINTLPAKAARYAIGLASGNLDIITGATISATDSFIIEKLLSGWRPNHFVQGPMRDFLR